MDSKKTAYDLLHDLYHAVKPPRGVPVSISERTPKEAGEANWRASVDVMPMDALTRFDSAVAELRRQHPEVDWTGVAVESGVRQISK